EPAFEGEIIKIEDPEIYAKGEAGEKSDEEIKEEESWWAEPHDLLYTIYTSGTTGKPKGVALENKNLVNYVTWFTKKAGITQKERSLLTSSFAFDLGYTVIYPTLLNGGQLHLVAREQYLFAESLLDYIKENGITYLKVTPSLFSIVVDTPFFTAEMCRSLRLAVMGGEAINVHDVERAHNLCPHIKIMNHYGPTETTIGSIARY
ncbi:MAG: AMP-binding protein, partial [bacterium]|nr:AMP-binding protein [bacterium]